MADQLAPLQQFEYLPGRNLRVLQKDGEPWFVAADVCKALEMSTDKGSGQWLRDLDPSEKHTLRIAQGNTRGNPNTTIISESGLYLLVLKSRKPEAKAFQKWVTGDAPGGLKTP